MALILPRASSQNPEPLLAGMNQGGTIPSPAAAWPFESESTQTTPAPSYSRSRLQGVRQWFGIPSRNILETTEKISEGSMYPPQSPSALPIFARDIWLRPSRTWLGWINSETIIKWCLALNSGFERLKRVSIEITKMPKTDVLSHDIIGNHWVCINNATYIHHRYHNS